MPNVNKAILIGVLGRDPELRYTPSGKAVCSFSLATSDKWKSADGEGQESTVWHNIVAWGKQAEVIKEYVTKGQHLYLEGRIVNRSYDDKEGNKKYTSEVVVQNFQFIGGKKTDSTTKEDTQPDLPGDNDNQDDLPF